MKRSLIFILLALSLVSVPAQEAVDTAIIDKIKEEAFGHSQVMEHAFWLTEVNGPRLTGSKGFFDAMLWAEMQLTAFGLQHMQKEPLEWGRGWTATGFRPELTSPSLLR